MVGGPVSEATQWEQSARVADGASPVCLALQRVAAQGEGLSQDDTQVRLLSLIAENRRAMSDEGPAPDRPGMHPTALVATQGLQPMVRYFSGRAHAGEHLPALLPPRQTTPAPLPVMSDALAANGTPAEGTLIRCAWLAHGHRKFHKLGEGFPAECLGVLTVLRQVLDHDAVARERQWTAGARLASHPQYSDPLLAGRKDWLAQQATVPLVEPNSRLGKAMAYLQRHWAALTQFLRPPGAPIGRVDDWRGVRRLPVAVPAPFDDGASVRLALAPFPAAARRTGRAELPHPALIQDLTSSRSTGFCCALAA
jgi:transposase